MSNTVVPMPSPGTEVTDKVGAPVQRGGVPGQVAAVTAAAGIGCMVVSGLLFFATGGVSAQGTPDTKAMLAAGASGSNLIVWACFVDLFGYLLLAPLAFYLHRRFRADPLIDLYTAAALAYVLVGALGAIILATAWPMLFQDYATANLAQRESIATTLATLNQVVSVGFWQILEGIPAGVWLIGIGTILFKARHRLVALVPFVLGGLLLLFALVRILGM
jgi:hypothetical protein